VCRATMLVTLIIGKATCNDGHDVLRTSTRALLCWSFASLCHVPTALPLFKCEIARSHDCLMMSRQDCVLAALEDVAMNAAQRGSEFKVSGSVFRFGSVLRHLDTKRVYKLVFIDIWSKKSAHACQSRCSLG
jgi:hypothetical protein